MSTLNHDRFREVFDAEFKKEEGDPIERLHRAMRASQRDMLEHFPVWMKFNFIANTSYKKEDSEIDWNYVNEMLHKNLAEDDYNCFGRIESKEQFAEEYNKLIDAQLDFAPFRKCVCKQCKDEFTLNFGEIESYQRKGLKLPKRCRYCRKGIEKPKPQPVVVKKVEEEPPMKTAMELALEKAGIK